MVAGGTCACGSVSRSATVSRGRVPVDAAPPMCAFCGSSTHPHLRQRRLHGLVDAGLRSSVRTPPAWPVPHTGCHTPLTPRRPSSCRSPAPFPARNPPPTSALPPAFPTTALRVVVSRVIIEHALKLYEAVDLDARISALESPQG